MNSNLPQAGLFLINTIFWLLMITVLLRFLLQLVKADFYNPVCQAVARVSDPLLRPLRRLIPGYRGIDIAALVLLLLTALINVVLIFRLYTGDWPMPLSAIYWAILKLAVVTVNLYFFSVLIQALLSWINPGSYNPVASLLWSINEPLLRPVRRLLPPLSGLDFSPVIVLIVLQLINILIPIPSVLR